MAQHTSNPKDRNLIAVIGDEVSFFRRRMMFDGRLMLKDSVTGLLLAGIGHVDNQQKKNFLIVDSSTSPLCSSH
jgi:V-type H+-transporting ATPase subunit F